VIQIFTKQGAGTPGVMVAGEGGQVTVSAGSLSMPVMVRSKAIAQQGHVLLSMGARHFGALLGTWSYYADPLTQRDKSGEGRSGTYRLLKKNELDELNDPPRGSEDEIGIPGRTS